MFFAVPFIHNRGIDDADYCYGYLKKKEEFFKSSYLLKGALRNLYHSYGVYSPEIH
jgi:hypothetical protein